MNEINLNRIVSFAALALIALPVGIACIILGFGMGDTPCILCWQERTAMVLVSLIALFIMRYGLKPKYIGALILTAVYGLWAGYRHSSNHILRDIGQGFGPAIFGVHTYVWVIVVFAIILLFAGALLLLQGDKLQDKPAPWSLFNKITINTFLVIIVFNIVQAFTQTGPFPFIGQSDPVRMSFNSDHIIWSTGNWPTPSKLSARGAYTIAKPDFANMSHDAQTQISTSNRAMASQQLQLPAAIEGLATGIAYQASTEMFAVVTSDNWVYFLSKDLTTILAQVKIDAAFSTEISNLAGVAFDGDNSVIVTADHKSYARVAYDPSAKIAHYYANFMDGTDGVKELTRSRFETTRAKYNYIGDIGFDAKTNEYLMVTLPVPTRNNFVVSRMSAADMKLNSEAIISLEVNALPQVTGIAIGDDNIYLLSHSGEQVLVMNRDNRVIDAINLEATTNPQALTLMDGQLAVLNANPGSNSISLFNVQ
ncbi:disulfide bond formation protein B [Shewanella sp. NIFS-20-20]|uniref:disulfide bond formation protein B n=1 Tax=Shewanella sp. NIFS-20-20 TaxID=2853806 RepID=UPI001C44C149|nr:disulfide bond formation protein B [Shewanella sp. NIFS-20-20]MBV7316508.1 disulfide bond formation protein B [Shewanella sp. NIFS-20-20]